ncbi:MAG: hypothetical protein FWD40_10050 [Treponema sp.]|nr:hypothetical protein [Treponema sp.]
MIRFLAEISSRSDIAIQPTPSNDFSRLRNIYYLDISPHPAGTYWEEWGGIYDNFTGTQIELYYSRFLSKASSEQELLDTPFSLLITNDFKVLINLPVHPWLYPNYATESSNVIPFLSAFLNPDNPSNNILHDAPAQVRLEIPNFNVKLSENISGMVLNQGFSISLLNNDGFFDDEDTWNLFNTPLYLKKAVNENPSYEDFKTIRYGLIENSQTDFDSFKIDIADRLKSMDEPACNLISRSNFPVNIEINDDAINKNISIVYGTKKVSLQKLNDSMYLAAEHVSQVSGVFDADDEELIYTFDTDTGIITILPVFEEDDKEKENPIIPEARTALITGYTDNNMCDVIIDIITRKTDIRFNEVHWNIDEINRYRNISPVINIIIDQGSIKNAVQDILKNDVAFFIQQSDGKFTIRKYGEIYREHNIQAWTITKRPEKTWSSAQQNYFSSCVINYGSLDKDTFKTLLYQERASEAEKKYRRRVTKTFDTDLVNEDDAKALAELLAKRFLIMRQSIKLSVGIDTSGYELMDIINLHIEINDRKFSRASRFIIKEINPAQDILTLEEIYDDRLDIDGGYAHTKYFDFEFDNMHASTADNEYKLILDGGS